LDRMTESSERAKAAADSADSAREQRLIGQRILAWKNLWRKSARQKAPADRWAAFASRVGQKQGHRYVVAKLIRARYKRPDEKGFLDEVIASIPSSDLCDGWVESWCTAYVDSATYAKALHDSHEARVFGDDGAALWRAIGRSGESGRAWLARFRDLGGVLLFNYYLSHPMRAGHVTRIAEDADLKLLELTDRNPWEPTQVIETVRACFENRPAATPAMPPPWPSRPHELDRRLAVAWVEELGSRRLKYVLVAGGESERAEREKCLPCTIRDEELRSKYIAAIVDATVGCLRDEPHLVLGLPTYVAELLSQSGEQGGVIVETLVSGLARKAFVWMDIASDLRNRLAEQIKANSHGPLALGISECVQEGRIALSELPDTLVEVLQEAAVKRADEEPETESPAGTQVELHEVEGNPEASVDADTTEAATDGSDDWITFARDLDPTTPDAIRLIPSRSSRSVVVALAKILYSRWCDPVSLVLSPSEAAADIARWDDQLLTERSSVLNYALGPLLDNETYGQAVLAAIWAHEHAPAKVARIAGKCMARGKFPRAGLLAAASGTAEELRDILRRALVVSRTHVAHRAQIGHVFKLWCSHRDLSGGYGVLISIIRELVADGLDIASVIDNDLSARILQSAAPDAPATTPDAEDGASGISLTDNAQAVAAHVAEFCEAMGTTDADHPLLLATLKNWADAKVPGRDLGSLWAFLLDLQSGEPLDVSDERIQELARIGFKYTVRGRDSAGQILGDIQQLCTVFRIPPEETADRVLEVTQDWLDGKPAEDKIVDFVEKVRHLFPSESDSDEERILTTVIKPIFEKIGLVDFWALLKSAAAQGLAWDDLPSYRDNQLQEDLRDCSFETAHEKIGAIDSPEFRDHLMETFCALAGPDIYERICMLRASAPEAEVEAYDRWAGGFRNAKLAWLRDLVATGSPTIQAGRLNQISAALSVFALDDHLDNLSPELCEALARESLSSGEVVDGVRIRIADQLFMIWSQNWRQSEDSSPWRDCWSRGFGESVMKVFGASPDSGEILRRRFACAVIQALFSPVAESREAILGILVEYRKRIPGMQFGAPLYVGDHAVSLRSDLANYSVSILRAVLAGQTEVGISPAMDELAAETLIDASESVRQTCSYVGRRLDTLSSRVFLPGGKGSSGNGVASLCAEYGAGLPEELALVLLLTLDADEEGLDLRREALLAAVDEILRLDLDLNNAGIGRAIRGLLEKVIGRLVPERWRCVLPHILGLRWRTGLMGDASKRESALHTDSPEHYDGDDAAWAHAARLAAVAYAAISSGAANHSLVADYLGAAREILDKANSDIGAVILKRIVLRTGLEAFCWGQSKVDLAPVRDCIGVACENPYVSRLHFERHLKSIQAPPLRTAEGWPSLLWRGYSDNVNGDGEEETPMVSGSENFGTTVLIKVRDHKWRLRLIKYNIAPYGSLTREISVSRLHAYKAYVEQVMPYTRLGRRVLQIDTVAPMDIYVTPQPYMPSRNNGVINIGVAQPIPELTAWGMSSVLMEYLDGESLVDFSQKLFGDFNLEAHKFLMSRFNSKKAKSLLSGPEAHGKHLRWCGMFWAFQQKELLQVAGWLDEILDSLATGRAVSLDFKPQHIFICNGARGPEPVLIDLDAFYLPDTEITLLNRCIEQSPYREPQYSAFLDALRNYSGLDLVQSPSEALPFHFTTQANRFVANLIQYEFFSMTPGLQAAPVGVPEYIRAEKRALMDDILRDSEDQVNGDDGEGVHHDEHLSITGLTERLLSDWPDLSDDDVVLVDAFDESGIMPRHMNHDDQDAFVSRLVRDAVDPPPSGIPSHPVWHHLIVPVAWVGGMENLPDLRGYDMLHILLRLFAEGATDADLDLIFDKDASIPDREDMAALEEYHRGCSRFYVSVGKGGREFWRRSRGGMLGRPVFKGHSPESLLTSEVIATFGRMQTMLRPGRRGVVQRGPELAVSNFSIRFADLPAMVQECKLTEPGGTSELTVVLSRDPANRAIAPHWEIIANTISHSDELEDILGDIPADAFLDDPNVWPFAMGTCAESVALGRKDETTLTNSKLEPGWASSLDLTPYLPEEDGGSVYVRARTAIFMFKVVWDS
jgi:hypothetical protein